MNIQTERSQYKKTHTIGFYSGENPKCKIYTNKKYISGCLEQWKREWEMLTKGYWLLREVLKML